MTVCPSVAYSTMKPFGCSQQACDISEISFSSIEAESFHTLEASNLQGSVATANFLSTSGVRLIVARCVLGFAVDSFGSAKLSKHEVRLANPLNLSI